MVWEYSEKKWKHVTHLNVSKVEANLDCCFKFCWGHTQVFSLCLNFLNAAANPMAVLQLNMLWLEFPLISAFLLCLLSSDDGWSSSARSGYDRDFEDRRHRDYSPVDRRRGDRGAHGGLQGRRSRSRDDLMDMERGRRGGGSATGGRDEYDDSFLREAMEKKKMGEQQRARSRDRLDNESDRSDRGRTPRGPPPLPQNPPSGLPGRRDDYPPPLPPPYSEDESVSSAKKSNLRKVSHSNLYIRWFQD